MTHVLSSDPETRVRFAAGLEIALSQERDATVVCITGDVDCASAPHLRDVLDALIMAGVETVIVDAADVGFLDSTGIGVLVTAQRHLTRQRGGSLTIRSPSRVVYRVLKIAGLVETFKVPQTYWFTARS